MTQPDRPTIQRPPEAAIRDAAAATRAGIDDAGDAAARNVGALSSNVDALGRAVLPVVEDGLDQAQTLIDRAMEAIEDAVAAVRATAQDATDQAAAYTREEPAKALMFAAAAGAGLMILLRLVGSRSDRRSS